MAKVTPSDSYSALVQFTTHAENTSWNRFYNFLMGNSILVLAWATIYVSDSEGLASNIVLLAICILGLMSGPAWATLGKRARQSLTRYLELGKTLEENADLFPTDLKDFRIFSRVLQIRKDLPGGWSGSYYILQAAPWAFAVLYFVLFAASVLRICPYGHAT